MNLAQQLEREEKRVPWVYPDSKGWLTLGIGRLVDKRKGGRLSDPEIDFLLANDIREKTAQVIAALPWTVNLSEPRMGAIVGMCFQLGIGNAEEGTGLLGFMLQSKWARLDSPDRARRMSRQIASGSWQ